MKTAAFLAALAASARAAPHPVAPRAPVATYGPDELMSSLASTAVSMEVMRQKKIDHQAEKEAQGVFAVDAYALQGATPCTNGTAGEYKCNNVDLLGFLRHQDMGSRTRVGNDVWGMFSAQISQ